jgi:hypothetical protein
MEDKSQEQNNNKPQISKKDFIYMLVVAIFFDLVLALIQLIPIAGSVAASVFNVIPLMGFFIWYKLLGLNFANPKKAFTFFGCSFIEFIPPINILPAWTASIVIMYILQKKDIILSKLSGVVGGAAGVTAMAGTGAKMLGARNLGKSLEQTAESLKGKSQNMRNSMTPNARMVGNEIRKPSQQKSNEPNNIVGFPQKEKAEGDNTIPFPGAEKHIPFSRDTFSEDRKAT